MKDKLQDFLNPKSAITIGASSTMVVAFTTTLCAAFHLPAAWVALGLSGLFALAQVAFISNVPKKWLRQVYWAICTLVIFNAANGGNGLLANGSQAVKDIEAGMTHLVAAAPMASAPDEGPMPPPPPGVPLAPDSVAAVDEHSSVPTNIGEVEYMMAPAEEQPKMSAEQKPVFRQWGWTSKE